MEQTFAIPWLAAFSASNDEVFGFECLQGYGLRVSGEDTDETNLAGGCLARSFPIWHPNGVGGCSG
jgi:hypothetical protein